MLHRPFLSTFFYRKRGPRNGTKSEHSYALFYANIFIFHIYIYILNCIVYIITERYCKKTALFVVIVLRCTAVYSHFYFIDCLWHIGTVEPHRHGKGFSKVKVDRRLRPTYRRLCLATGCLFWPTGQVAGSRCHGNRRRAKGLCRLLSAERNHRKLVRER